MLEELHGEQVAPVTEEPRDVLGVRNLMIRLAQLKREGERLKETKKAVVASYDERISAVDTEVETLRVYLRNYVERVNGGKAVSLPDVGTAYLMPVKARTVISDHAAAAQWATERDDLWVTSLDEKAYLAEAIKALEDNGEILPGVEVIPARETLAVKL